MSMNKRAALALILAAATPALAQFGGRRRGGAQMDKAEKGGAESVNPLEVTVEELRQDLKLTAEQEPVWQSYVDKLRALAGDVARERNRRTAAGGSVPQQIDRIVDAARNRLTALEEVADSAKALYAKLAPEQQPAADPRLANLMTMPLAANDAPRGRAPR